MPLDTVVSQRTFVHKFKYGYGPFVLTNTKSDTSYVSLALFWLGSFISHTDSAPPASTQASLGSTGENCRSVMGLV